MTHGQHRAQDLVAQFWMQKIKKHRPLVKVSDDQLPDLANDNTVSGLASSMSKALRQHPRQLQWTTTTSSGTETELSLAS